MKVGGNQADQLFSWEQRSACPASLIFEFIATLGSGAAATSGEGRMRHEALLLADASSAIAGVSLDQNSLLFLIAGCAFVQQ